MDMAPPLSLWIGHTVEIIDDISTGDMAKDSLQSVRKVCLGPWVSRESAQKLKNVSFLKINLPMLQFVTFLFF